MLIATGQVDAQSHHHDRLHTFVETLPGESAI